MRTLACLLLIALPSFPALAEDAVADAGAAPAQIAAPHADAQPAAQDAQPRKKRALACPACATDGMPSFAIKPAEGNGTASPAAGSQSTAAGTDVQGSAASEPPVNFSFAASGQSYSNRNRYRGGVYVAAPF